MIVRGREALVVVGNGMAGVRALEEVLARAPDRYTITVFGDEPHLAYDRIQLSAVLGGFRDPAGITLRPLEWYEEHGIRLHAGVRAESINLAERVVAGGCRNGAVMGEPYDKLILATGSRPFVPPIEGADKENVFLFRTIEDCAAIAAQARQSKRAIVT